MDFKLDLVTGDLDVTNGLQTVTAGRQRQQQLKLGLSINLGEWFADVNFGVPYIDTKEDFNEEAVVWLLSDTFPNTENYIKQVLDDFITSKAWVTSLTSSFSFNKSKREYRYEYRVATTDGGEFSDSIESGTI